MVQFTAYIIWFNVLMLVAEFKRLGWIKLLANLL